jgi:protocatechuate 3,4-dioxygenase beta subunit
MSNDPATPCDPTAINRRDLLGRAAMAATTLIVSRALPVLGATASRPARAGTRPGSCVLTAALEEGPFFVDEKLNRSDIRSDPTSGAMASGTLLRLTFNVGRAVAGACAPLTGATLDVWHCDATGVYSDEEDSGTRVRYLRGYQVTDGSGVARFVTIYPGWYPGRTVHIHFKLRLPAGSATRYEFTSQLFFDEALTKTVHAAGPYAARRGRDTFNTDDGLYMSLPAAQRAALTLPTTKVGDAYEGVINCTVAVG